MLVIHDVWARGRHGNLFDPISFEVESGEVIIVQADSQLERNALALTLTGRMKPSGGEIFSRDSDTGKEFRLSLKHLRQRSEIIDAPEINEPENHMRVRDYVSEMLSYMQSGFSRPKPEQWFEEHNLTDLADSWFEQISGAQRLLIMSALADSYPQANLLVFDTPSRHLNHTSMWIDHLVQLAEDQDQPRAVVALVPHISSKWNGKTAVVGNAAEESASQTSDAQDFETESN